LKIIKNIYKLTSHKKESAMKSPSKEQLEFWREHILKSDRHPEGRQAYCRLNNLPESTFYKWRLKIFGPNKKSQSINSKKVQSPFLPVVVATSELNSRTYPQKNTLPDAHWVAEIITQVIRGLA
jgi:hypothetical protein